MSMKLIVTLSPAEEANIHGWVNYYLAHPHEVPTRIVLEERTQERLREVAAQFSAVVPPPLTPVPVLEMPWTGGNFRRELPAFSEPLAFRFVVTAGPKPQSGYSTIVEYRGEPALRHCTLSRWPGDFRPVDPAGVNGPLDASQGVQATVFWNLPPGTYYLNVRNVHLGVWPALVETSWPR